MMRTTEDYNGRGEERFAFIDRGRLLRQAEASLHADTVHITDDVAPMSEGGIHDFYSNGDYWWPNPETADGLPYIRRDGESNPNNFDRHRLGLRRMRTHTANLASAYKESVRRNRKSIVSSRNLTVICLSGKKGCVVYGKI
ncbi:Alginate lyase [Paenibacillus konkukensis]|uniref:Alginate lyase n=1 Tax=Paenibacillus konkukensis TaxID=2020716 RepID=A0ABY4RWH4_9BACL|nr:alginate lyase family protein [Paenibacillus konkukensis]UQZ86667.1 Alginate lyase [Paenibacillus konkukensis]